MIGGNVTKFAAFHAARHRRRRLLGTAGIMALGASLVASGVALATPVLVLSRAALGSNDLIT